MTSAGWSFQIKLDYFSVRSYEVLLAELHPISIIHLIVDPTSMQSIIAETSQKVQKAGNHWLLFAIKPLPLLLQNGSGNCQPGCRRECLRVLRGIE
jgi:hypothetical protein